MSEKWTRPDLARRGPTWRRRGQRSRIRTRTASACRCGAASTDVAKPSPHNATRIRPASSPRSTGSPPVTTTSSRPTSTPTPSSRSSADNATATARPTRTAGVSTPRPAIPTRSASSEPGVTPKAERIASASPVANQSPGPVRTRARPPPRSPERVPNSPHLTRYELAHSADQRHRDRGRLALDQVGGGRHLIGDRARRDRQRPPVGVDRAAQVVHHPDPGRAEREVHLAYAPGPAARVAEHHGEPFDTEGRLQLREERRAYPVRVRRQQEHAVEV